VSNFIDTAFNNCLFMWDSAFILLFARYRTHTHTHTARTARTEYAFVLMNAVASPAGRYGSRAFDFQRTLDNFYAKQHPDGYTYTAPALHSRPLGHPT
jgi:hypothetical protein